MSLVLSSDESKPYMQRLLDAIYEQVLNGRQKKNKIDDLIIDISDAWIISNANGEYENCEIIGEVAEHLKIFGKPPESAAARFLLIQTIWMEHQRSLDMKKLEEITSDSDALDRFLDSFPITGGEAA